ncbi:MAG: DUF4212 domain-containing protein [Pararobbsia sp.]
MPLDTPDAVARADSLSRARRNYWRFNVRVIVVLLSVAAIVSFGVPLVAEHLKNVRVAGWSLPFYIGAQGAILVYLALVLIYALAMGRADRRLRRVLKEQTSDGESVSGEIPPADPYASAADIDRFSR